MLGTVVNTLAIVAGSLLGLLLRRGIPERINQSVIHAIGLSVILIGLRGALGCDELLVVILSMALGAVLGEWIGIEAALQRAGDSLGKRLSVGGDGAARGFVTASLVFCVGAMAIVGSLESGLSGNHQTLFAKSILDGITSVIFASSLGFGVVFSAVSVFVYQGAVTLAAGWIKPLLNPQVVQQMSAVGGLLIAAIGTNLLDMTRLRVGNLLPAVFLPLLYSLLRSLWG